MLLYLITEEGVRLVMYSVWGPEGVRLVMYSVWGLISALSQKTFFIG